MRLSPISPTRTWTKNAAARLEAAAADAARALAGEDPGRLHGGRLSTPVAINIECQLTSAAPCLGLYELADRQQNVPGFLSNSVMLGFPYSDVPEMGSAVLTVTDGDPALGSARLADELAAYLWQHRQDFIAYD